MSLRRDLFAEVTVFVTTVGAPTFAACLEHLGRQDCLFRLDVIDRVAPLSAALQRMLDTCLTPFYVQVDEDILLYRHAVRTLYERIASRPEVAIVVGDLYDEHLERCIQGVKIFRHAVVRRYPISGFADWVALRMEGLRRDGYEIVQTPLTHRARDAEGALGRHGTAWTAQSIYERYAGLTRRWLTRPDRGWFGEYPQIFLHRFLRDPSALNFAALMGVLAGTLDCESARGLEKDFRHYDRQPGFAAAARFWRELTGRALEP